MRFGRCTRTQKDFGRQVVPVLRNLPRAPVAEVAGISERALREILAGNASGRATAQPRPRPSKPPGCRSSALDENRRFAWKAVVPGSGQARLGVVHGLRHRMGSTDGGRASGRGSLSHADSK